MASSSGSSIAVSRQGLLPVCRCGVPMRMFIANTGLNPKRPFWKCVNWDKPISCKLYIWDDLLDPEKMPMVAVESAPLAIPENNYEAGITTTMRKCNCGEREAQKIAKLKLKLVEERRKMKWMQLVLIVVILYVAYHKVGFV